MRREVLPLLRCPRCSSRNFSCTALGRETEEEVLDGVLACRTCNSWFPIEDGLLELLTGALAYTGDRLQFWGKYRSRIEDLGLTLEPAPEGEGPGMELQLAQQAHFDWYSTNQAQTYNEYENSPFWLAADRIAFSAWRDEIKPGAMLLDVGCAQGRSTFKVLDLEIDVVAFDLSKRLVRQAIERYRAESPRGRACFFVADASNLPFVDSCFDYVLVYGVLHHLPNVDRACREIARVLRMGGSYFGQENNDSALRKIFDLFQRTWPQWHEEAGPEALLASDMLRDLLQGEGIALQTRSSVFLPPHLLNLSPPAIAYRALRAADVIAAHLPYIRKNGGVLLLHGSKAGRPQC